MNFFKCCKRNQEQERATPTNRKIKSAQEMYNLSVKPHYSETRSESDVYKVVRKRGIDIITSPNNKLFFEHFNQIAINRKFTDKGVRDIIDLLIKIKFDFCIGGTIDTSNIHKIETGLSNELNETANFPSNQNPIKNMFSRNIEFMDDDH